MLGTALEEQITSRFVVARQLHSKEAYAPMPSLVEDIYQKNSAAPQKLA